MAKDIEHPRPLGDENTHFWLIQRMARATDVDLVAAMETGLIDNQSWADLIESCRACTWSEGCQRWLDAPIDTVRDFPANCRNATQLAALCDALPKKPD